MRILVRSLIVILVIVCSLLVLLFGSVAVDMVAGQGRVAALTNTEIVREGGAPIRAFVARPPGPGPHPAVMMLHEFWGLKPEIVGKAEALAAEGYVVVAPDMYRGSTTDWLLRAIFLALTVPETQVLSDLDPVFAWLSAQEDVDPARIVVMGFCYGGGKSLAYSLRNDRLAGTGVFYGTLLDDPAQLARLSGPVLGIFGREDRAPSPEMVTRFEAALEAAAVPHEITIYDGVGHAFVTDIDAIRQGGAPGAAWAQFLAWLKQTVG